MNASDGLAPRAASLTSARFLALALPVTLSNLSTPMLGVVNAAAIGRLGDTALLGAVALGAVIFDILFWTFGFLRMGTAGLSAQAFGAGDKQEMRDAFWRSLMIAAAIGGLMLILRGPVLEIALNYMRPGPDVASAARDYFNARIWSAPIALANYAVLGSLIGRARTDLGLATQIIINLANIALSLLFVTVLGYGVIGVGYASVIAEVIGLIVGLSFQAREGFFHAPSWASIFNRERVLRTLAINRDIFLRTLALIAAISFFTRQGARAGDAILAANAVLHNLFMIGAFFLDGFATATEQTAGQAVGARDRKGFGVAVRLGAFWCVGFGAAASLLFYIGGEMFIDFITTSPEVRETARVYLIFAALTPLAGALAFLFDGVFIGATWARAMRDTMLVALALAALTYWLTRPYGNVGLWITFLAFFMFRGAAQTVLFPSLERKTFESLRS